MSRPGLYIIVWCCLLNSCDSQRDSAAALKLLQAHLAKIEQVAP